ncbi:MAG: class I SAM-dependent methyltransferase [bacterium]
MSDVKEMILDQTSAVDHADAVRKLRQVGIAKGLWRRGDKFVHYCKGQLFKGIDFQGKTMLDIGCGDGLYLIWGGIHGASRLVGLEPLLDGSGSTKNSEVVFYGMSEALNLKNIERQPFTLQEYQCAEETFDIVLLHASVNHLDESMCIELRENAKAREIYLELFRKLRGIMKKNGQLIIVDASNRNFFGDLGMKHILYPKLAYNKHQTPFFWSKLLRQTGFDSPKVSWISNPALGPLGWFLRNRVTSYFLESTFRLVMTAV